MPTSKEQLLNIIQNGRRFLTALEQFAASNFPNDDDKEAATLLNLLQDNGESSDRFDDAERDSDDEDGHVTRTPPSIRVARKKAPPTNAANESSPIVEQKTTHPDIEDQNPARNHTTKMPTPLPRRRPTLPIAQFCAETGSILAQFDSLDEAAESLAKSLSGIKVASCRGAISAVLNGHRKTPVYKGYYYRRIGDTTSPMPSFPISRKSRHATRRAAQADHSSNSYGTGRKRKNEEQNTTNPWSRKTKRTKSTSVLQFCAETGEQLGTFETTTAAAKFLASSIPGAREGPLLTGISQVLRGRQKRPVFMGFYFRYSNDIFSPFPEFPIPQKWEEWRNTALGKFRMEEDRRKSEEARENATFLVGKRGRNQGVLQFCSVTGIQLGTFDSRNDAAAELAKSIPRTSRKQIQRGISAALRGINKKRVYKGSYFRYVDDTVSPMPTFPIQPRSKFSNRHSNHDGNDSIAKSDTIQNDQSSHDSDGEESSVQGTAVDATSRHDKDSLEQPPAVNDSGDNLSTQENDQNSKDANRHNSPVQGATVDAPATQDKDGWEESSERTATCSGSGDNDVSTQSTPKQTDECNQAKSTHAEQFREDDGSLEETTSISNHSGEKSATRQPTSPQTKSEKSEQDVKSKGDESHPSTTAIAEV